MIGTLISGSIYFSALAGIGYSSLSFGKANKTEPLNVECHITYRSRMIVSVQQQDRVSLTSAENAKTIKMGDLALHTQYLSNQKSGETESFEISVTPADNARKLAAFSYPMSNIKQRQNQFSGEHGFTGLSYVYYPKSRSELKYWCAIP